MYTIEIYYRTGDSFGSEETTDTVGCTWKDKDLARQALSDIKAHYNIFHSSEYNPKANRKASQKEWYSSEYSSSCLMVVTDSGVKQRISTFWLGYFESLLEAKVVNDEDDKDVFVPEEY